MPSYDYHCDACDRIFEAQHPIGRGPSRCPACGSARIRRDWSKPPAYHARYSPMHPRKNRGRGY